MFCSSVRPITFNTAYATRLNSLGLYRKALRSQYKCCRRAYADSSGAVFDKITEWDSMLRTMPRHAKELSKEYSAKYQPFRVLLSDSFTVLRLTSPLSSNPHAGTEKLRIMQGRGIIKPLIGDAIVMAGASDNTIFDKVLCFQSLNRATIALIESTLPPGVTLTWKTLSARHFDVELEALIAPDLPTDDIARANLEYIYHHLKQVTAFGAAYALSCNKKPKNYKVASNPLNTLMPVSDGDRPINPATGLRAVRHTCDIPLDLPLDQIPAEFWEYYPDLYEEDGTTEAEYAEMNRELEKLAA